MAIETHSVTVSDVLSVLPFDTSRITPSSDPVDTGMITDWIEDGAGILNASLERHGIDPATDMTPNGSEVVRRGIVAYAACQSLTKAGFTGARLQEFKSTFETVERTIKDDPQSLGDTQSAKATIKSNVDPTAKTETEFGKDFGGW